MLDFIILLGIAIFIFVKLFNSLGVHNKEDSQNKDKTDSFFGRIKKRAEPDKYRADIDIVSALEASLSPEIRDVMDKIRKYDSLFTADKFIDGAQKAFLIILKAFSECDRDTLKKLLAKDVYSAFDVDVASRLATNKKMTIAVISSKMEIKSASIENSDVSIDVDINSEQISFVKDSLGNTVMGHESNIRTKHDTWRFSKTLGKSDIWILSHTSS